jgi:hypothetical protein
VRKNDDQIMYEYKVIHRRKSNTAGKYQLMDKGPTEEDGYSAGNHQFMDENFIGGTVFLRSWTLIHTIKIKIAKKSS